LRWSRGTPGLYSTVLYEEKGVGEGEKKEAYAKSVKKERGGQPRVILFLRKEVLVSSHRKKQLSGREGCKGRDH